MIIKKNSWHYQLHCFWNTTTFSKLYYRSGEPVTLCSYFWLTLLTLFSTIVFALLALAATIAMLIAPVMIWFNSKYHSYWILVCGLDTIMLLIFLEDRYDWFRRFGKWIEKVAETKLEQVKESEQHVENELGLVGSWIKAKKDKFCPILQLEKEILNELGERK